MSSIHDNNLVFIDKKSLVPNDIRKLKLRQDPFIGNISKMLIDRANMHKRCNKICTIRPFCISYSRKIFRYMIMEDSRTTEYFQQFM